jgi:hypothetical protein
LFDPGPSYWEKIGDPAGGLVISVGHREQDIRGPVIARPLAGYSQAMASPQTDYS